MTDAAILRREYQVGGVVSFAHLLSHFYVLVLPPIFPLARGDLGMGYAELGLAVGANAITTGLLQTPMGFLVNRLGARPVLIAGLFLNALAIALVGVVSASWQVLALMALAGVGSSVFHPADYAILNARIDSSRIGRALAVHTLGGNLGFVFAPLVMTGLAAVFDWRRAMIIAGGIGMVLAVALIGLSGSIGESGKQRRGQRADSWMKLIGSPRIMLLFLFYGLSSAANCGIVYFSSAALHDIYALPLTATAIALTVYQVASMVAVLPGGWIADRVQNHEFVLACCFGASGILVVLAGIGAAPFMLSIALIAAAGFARGLVNASRDVSVRHAAVDVSVGTLFGFVTTAYAGGQFFGPMLYGWLMDHGHPQTIFWVSALFSSLAICTMLTGWAWRTKVVAAE